MTRHQKPNKEANDDDEAELSSFSSLLRLKKLTGDFPGELEPSEKAEFPDSGGLVASFLPNEKEKFDSDADASGSGAELPKLNAPESELDSWLNPNEKEGKFDEWPCSSENPANCDSTGVGLRFECPGGRFVGIANWKSFFTADFAGLCCKDLIGEGGVGLIFKKNRSY